MVLAILPILMCIISLTLHRTMNIFVYNLTPYIELTSPVCFCNRGRHHKCIIEKTDAAVTTKIDFKFEPDQDEIRGILTYEVQRTAIFDYPSNIDSIYANVTEDALKMMLLLLIWKIKRFEESKVDIMLLEYGDKLVMREDKLVQLYENVDGMFSKSKRLMCDNAVLETRHEVVWKEEPELKIIISRLVNNQSNRLALWIDPER
jgi:hypothetical protein